MISQRAWDLMCGLFAGLLIGAIFSRAFGPAPMSTTIGLSITVLCASIGTGIRAAMRDHRQ